MYWFRCLVFILGVVCVSAGLVSYVKKNSCIERVMARYVGQVQYRGGKGVSLYAVKMQYVYMGRDIVSSSLDLYSQSKLKRNFNEEQEYKINVNPNKPSNFYINKNIWSDTILFCIGILFLLFGAMI